MTIKEIESLSGMTRANVRYYEQEGLLSPLRASNGYRDYSAEDLAILNRIRLLRSLDISLEEIRALQSGTARLTDTLARKLHDLEQVKRDASYAQKVCRVMREDQVTYQTLDAQKYLDGIPQPESETGYFSIAKDTVPQVFYPWRRFFARMLDISAYSVVWSALLALLFHVNLSQRSGILDLFDTMIAVLIMLFVEPLLLRLFGTTLGKWIFGLYLENEDGGRPCYTAGLSRTWGVIGSGLGFYIPIYNLFTLWKSYKRCSGQERQPWDYELAYSIRDTKWYRGVASVSAAGILFSLLVAAFLIASLPPNRGELTVAEFAENYNILSAYYGINGKYLDSEGKWADRDDGPAVIEIGGISLSDFTYTVEDGIVTGIRLEVRTDDDSGLLIFGGNEMVLSALSFAGAQKEAGIFPGVRSDMAKTISEHLFADFSIREAGVNIVNEVTCSGYDSTFLEQGVLLPQEGVEAHFHLLFSMDKAYG